MDARYTVPAVQASSTSLGQAAHFYAPIGFGVAELRPSRTPVPSSSPRRLCDHSGPGGPSPCPDWGRRRRAAPPVRRPCIPLTSSASCTPAGPARWCVADHGAPGTLRPELKCPGSIFFSGSVRAVSGALC
ncbi:hypothetical protein NDU88_001013 [Pleurodeles waltl]|uniref:Uncharacterized protein n=1 Tax=Pleurodeles waltl TaxID=8319 RepID=A0AAV7P5F0_PLEWA|nr:hypothetical protein NDU88_001013 [Pleurodeles waltl]